MVLISYLQSKKERRWQKVSAKTIMDYGVCVCELIKLFIREKVSKPRQGFLGRKKTPGGKQTKIVRAAIFFSFPPRFTSNFSSIFFWCGASRAQK